MEIALKTTVIPAVGSGLPRSPGLHLSDVLEYVGKELGLVRGRGNGAPKENYWETGFMFEDVLSLVLGDRLGQRPEEVTLDNIIGSPDGIGFCPDRGIVLEEYKATWKKMPMPQDLDNWRWQIQIKSYMRMCGITSGYCLLRVLWLNGDYRPPAPQYREYWLSFTEEEIEKNWEMILQNKEAADAARLRASE